MQPPIDNPLTAVKDAGKSHAQERTEELPRLSERNFKLIVDNIPGLVFTTSPNGELEFVNRRVLEYFGRSLAELKQWATTDSIHPDDVPSVLAARKRAIDAGESYESPGHRLRRADGTYRWFTGRTKICGEIVQSALARSGAEDDHAQARHTPKVPFVCRPDEHTVFKFKGRRRDD